MQILFIEAIIETDLKEKSHDEFFHPTKAGSERHSRNKKSISTFPVK